MCSGSIDVVSDNKTMEIEMATEKFHGFKVNDGVTCHGYRGTVTKLCDWSLSDNGEGMVEVRLARGGVCVSSSDLRLENQGA